MYKLLGNWKQRIKRSKKVKKGKKPNDPFFRGAPEHSIFQAQCLKFIPQAYLDQFPNWEGKEME